MQQKYLGMRTIKTGIAVALCLVYSFYIVHDVAFFTTIVAIATMGRTIGLSIMECGNQLRGTIFGGVCGIIFTLFFEPTNIIAMSISVILVIVLTNVIKYPINAVMASIIFSAIALGLPETSALIYALNRLVETIVGIIISLSVNIFFLPYDNSRKIHSMIYALDKKIVLAMSDRITSFKFADIHEIYSELSLINDEITMFSTEIIRKKHRRAETAKLFSCHQLLETMYSELVTILHIDTTPILTSENIERLKSAGVIILNQDHTSKSFTTEEYTVINFHVSKFLDAHDVLFDVLNT